MSEFVIVGDDEDGYHVWIQLEEGDPTQQGESVIVGHGDGFIIRQGKTWEAAVSDAIGALEMDVNTLLRLRERVRGTR